MRGYWHFTAIATAISILTVYSDSYLFIIGFFLWMVYLYYCHQLGKLPIIISFVFLLFFSFYIPGIDINSSPDERMLADDESFTGKIVRPPSITEKKAEWLLQGEQSNHKTAVVFFPGKEPTHLSLQYYSLFKLGSRCTVKGKLNSPSQARNPGQFDFQKYSLQQGISSQIIISSPEDMQCTGASPLHSIYSFRMKLMDHIDMTFSGYTSAWLKGLVFGDDSSIDEDVSDLFKKWSLSHLLAISGLHVGLVVGLLYFLLVKLNIVTREGAQWLLICFLPIYALLAGGEPSVKRACGMVLLFIILNKIKLRFSVTDTLSIVFLLLIVSDKFIVYHAGFQLSFAVTFGLMLSRSWFGQSDSRFVQVLRVSFVSQLMILPLQLAYFSTFQPLSILINVLAVPYFSLFVIPFMFILLPLSFLPTVLTGLFDHLFVSIQKLFIVMLEKVDVFADFSFVIGDIPAGFTISYYVLFFIFMRYVQKEYMGKAFAYGCCLSLLICIMAIRPYLSPAGSVTMLDMGQGDVYVIELPYRKGVIFMDAGANFSFDDFQPDEKVYEHIIKPYLYSKGISKVDAVLLSHEDVDHMGSVPFMIEDIGVDEVIISDYYELDQQTATEWEAHGAHIKRLSHKEKININGQHFQAVAPVKNMNSPNENSLVVLTELGGMSWLFTGDAGVQAEKEIMKTYPHLTADVLKVGHHGSDTSTSEAFVNQLQPDYALISAGENNSYGHPAKEVLDTMENENVHIFRSDLDGAVQFHFKNNRGTFSKHLP